MPYLRERIGLGSVLGLTSALALAGCAIKHDEGNERGEVKQFDVAPPFFHRGNAALYGMVTPPPHPSVTKGSYATASCPTLFNALTSDLVVSGRNTWTADAGNTAIIQITFTLQGSSTAVCFLNATDNVTGIKYVIFAAPVPNGSPEVEDAPLP